MGEQTEMCNENANVTTRFSPPQAKAIIKDLFRHDQRIYWADFLSSITVGYAAAGLYLAAQWTSPVKYLSLFLAVVMLYRVGLFMHELVHFPRREMNAFRLAWNIFAGIPMLSPSFFYEPHHQHHNARHYGTDDDGEYLPLGNGTIKDVLIFLSQVFLLPILAGLRFLVLTPISFMSPSLRTWVLQRASSFVIDLNHRREIPPDAPRF